MKIGVIKEIKNNENRVSMTPQGAKSLVDAGHEVLIETAAGVGSGFSDEQYNEAGASIESLRDVWDSDLIVKVKEPLEQEYHFFKKNQIIFTYLHLTGTPEVLTNNLVSKNVTSIAYETVQKGGTLPLLAPMSEIAGRLAVHFGSVYLMKSYGGNGILLDKITGVENTKTVVFGGGSVGEASARSAVSLGSDVTLFDINQERLDFLSSSISNDQFYAVLSDQQSQDKVAETVSKADLVVGAVLVPGARPPIVLSEDMVKTMKKGSVIVDVAIDQGGCLETSMPTTHSDPVYEKHGVIHYCVTNMPAAVPRTSTLALTTATLPYIQKIAAESLENVLSRDESLLCGVNTHNGNITCKPVADFFNKPYVHPLKC